MTTLDLDNSVPNKTLIPWETPFSKAEWPSVGLIVTEDKELGDVLLAIVAPGGIDQYPKYLVHFGSVVAFCSFEEAHAPRDFSSFELPKEKLCAFEFLDSPWLISYDSWEHFFDGPENIETHEPLKLRHFLIFGGDNNIEVITPNTPFFETVSEPRTLDIKIEI